MLNANNTMSDYYQEAKSWYHEHYESLLCSRNRYRLFALIMSVLLGLSLMAIMMLLPLKQYVYRLITVHQQTGEVTVLKQIEGHEYSANWAVSRYFITHYIQARESYSLEDIKRNYNLVIAMSGKPIANQYMADTVDSNPKSPIKILNNTYYKEVKVLSINRLNANTAMARYQTITRNKTDLNEIKTEDYQAIIKWEYLNRSESLEQQDKNPLGFTVQYYQSSPVFAEK